MRRAQPLLAVVEAAALAFVIAGSVSLTACAKTPAAAHPSEAAAVAAGAPSKPGEDTTPPPGVDLSKLDDFGKKVFFRIANSEPSICGQAQSLIQSAKDTKAGCAKSAAALRYVVKLVEKGYTDSEVSESLTKRYRPVAPKKIDISKAPVKGSPSAKITLIEFADYECPHCKRFQPVLRQILDEFKGDVRLYFKHYPLPQHTNARLAAEAAVAAQKQGKFWQYQDKLWENQDSLTPAELEKYAKEIGLDMAKFRAEMDDAKSKARVQKDRVDGQTLGLASTPTLYINGREYTDAKDTESLREWIKEELAK